MQIAKPCWPASCLSALLTPPWLGDGSEWSLQLLSRRLIYNHGLSKRAMSLDAFCLCRPRSNSKKLPSTCLIRPGPPEGHLTFCRSFDVAAEIIISKQTTPEPSYSVYVSLAGFYGCSFQGDRWLLVSLSLNLVELVLSSFWLSVVGCNRTKSLLWLTAFTSKRRVCFWLILWQLIQALSPGIRQS